MNDVLPDSTSIVLRATHVLVVRVQAARFGDWTDSTTGARRRTADLSLALEEVLKGTTEEPAGAALSVQVEQFAPPTTRIAPVPGAWSDAPTEPGTRLVAFCRAAGARAAEMLRDPFCEALFPFDAAMPDTALAVRAERAQLGLRGLLEEAGPVAASLSHLFADYLWAQHGQAAMADTESFERLLAFLERPDLSYPARATLLDAVYSACVSSSVAVERVQRLSFTLFRLLEVPSAAPLHDNILSVFLPNLLGLSAGGQARTAKAVFEQLPAERQNAERLLMHHQGRASTADLLRWVRT